MNQACENEAFGEVLEYIFHLGNLLNFGDDTDYTTCVKSFSISSLAKLSQTKAYEGGTTFLQYVVQSIEVCCVMLLLATVREPLFTDSCLYVISAMSHNLHGSMSS